MNGLGVWDWELEFCCCFESVWRFVGDLVSLRCFVFIFIFLFVCFCGFVSALGVKCLKIWNDLWILVFFLVLWFWGLWFNYWFVVVRVIFGLRFDFCLFVCLFDFVGFLVLRLLILKMGKCNISNGSDCLLVFLFFVIIFSFSFLWWFLWEKWVLCGLWLWSWWRNGWFIA